MRLLLLLCIGTSHNILSYQYVIENKTNKKIRVTINYTVNQDVREIEPGAYKTLDNGLRCLNSITAQTVNPPYLQDVWNINCDKIFSYGIDCCSGFKITINANPDRLIISLARSSKPISRNRYTERI